MRNKRTCCCQYHFPRTLCCPMNYCCSCIYLLNDSSPNLSPRIYNFNDSEPLLIPKKEKELFVRSEKSFTKKNVELPNNISNVNNSSTQFDKKNNYRFPSQSNKYHLNLEVEEETNNMTKTKDEIKENINDNNITNEKEIPKKYKKISVNKNKQDRATTCPVSYKTKKRKKIIDMNNCLPIIHTKKDKAKYINNYEINNNKTRKKNEIFINKNIVDNMKYKNNNNNKKINATKHSEEKRLHFNSMMDNKLKMSDLSDDIIDIKPKSFTIENDGNKIIIENLKIEIDKAKQIIHVLKNENEKLKIKLYYKEQNMNKNKAKKVIKVNKSTNTPNYNENEKEKNKNETIDKDYFEKEVNSLKNEISEVNFKLNEYENFISILKKRNNEQEKIIKKKDKEIMELMFKLESIEKENKNKLNELNIRSIEMIKEKDNISSDYKLNNETLKQEIIKLQEMLQNRNNRIKELEIKIKYEKGFDHKKQKLLELLYEFYVKIKKIINFDKFKESFRDILEIMSVDEFETKLNQVGKKVKQIIDDIQIKYGHCFACDIACCTSHVDKLKTFRKNLVKK